MDERALEVDHIIPRARGGSDDASNLQALCYCCNAMKRYCDDTDFRAVGAAYEHREAGCVFCEVSRSGDAREPACGRDRGQVSGYARSRTRAMYSDVPDSTLVSTAALMLGKWFSTATST